MAGVIVIWRPATVIVPPMPMPMTFCRPLRLQPVRQLVDADDRRAGRARHLHDVGRVIGMAVRQQDQVGLVDLFVSGGHIGFPSSHGSVTIRLPPGVVMTKVAWPSQVIER